MMNSACEAVAGNCWAGIIEPLGAMQTPFSDLIFNTTIGVAPFNREFRCVALGHVLSRMTGVSAGEQLGKTIGQFLPDEACLLESSCRHVWDTGDSLRNLELSVHCFSKPERRAWISSVYPVRDEFGQVKLLVAIFSDVTLRRCAERKLANSKTSLESPRKTTFTRWAESSLNFRPGLMSFLCVRSICLAAPRHCDATPWKCESRRAWREPPCFCAELTIRKSLPAPVVRNWKPKKSLSTRSLSRKTNWPRAAQVRGNASSSIIWRMANRTRRSLRFSELASGRWSFIGRGSC